MTATIAGTVTSSATAIITSPRRSTDLRSAMHKAKGGAWRLPPLLSYYMSSRKRARSTYVSRATRTAKAV